MTQSSPQYRLACERVRQTHIHPVMSHFFSKFIDITPIKESDMAICKKLYADGYYGRAWHYYDLCIEAMHGEPTLVDKIEAIKIKDSRARSITQQPTELTFTSTCGEVKHE